MRISPLLTRANKLTCTYTRESDVHTYDSIIWRAPRGLALMHIPVTAASGNCATARHECRLVAKSKRHLRASGLGSGDSRDLHSLPESVHQYITILPSLSYKSNACLLFARGGSGSNISRYYSPHHDLTHPRANQPKPCCTTRVLHKICFIISLSSAADIMRRETTVRGMHACTHAGARGRAGEHACIASLSCPSSF